MLLYILFSPGKPLCLLQNLNPRGTDKTELLPPPFTWSVLATGMHGKRGQAQCLPCELL